MIDISINQTTSLAHDSMNSTEIQHSLQQSAILHSLIVGGDIIIGVGIIIAVFFMGLAFYIVNTLTRPKRTHYSDVQLVLDIPFEEITFPPLHGDYLVQGVYIPRQGATTTIVVSPGYHSLFSEVFGVSKKLWEGGHNILAFEYYGHGDLVGVPINLAYREVNDFRAAVSYALQRDPQTHIGVLGYSMGGAVSIIGSTLVAEVEAVIADSSFASHRSAIEQAIRRTLRLAPGSFTTGVNVLLWMVDIFLALRAGYHSHQVEPQRDIARLTPRPILLIHGLKDTTVNPDDATHLYKAAHEPKELWLVADTEHVNAYFTDTDLYMTRILTFFDQYLHQQKSALLEQGKVVS